MKLYFELEIEGPLYDPDQLEDLRTEMLSSAMGVLCDIRHGPDGGSGLTNMANITAEVEALRKAIEDEGPVPRHHRDVMSASRRDWPTLWAAIDDVVDQDREYPTWSS